MMETLKKINALLDSWFSFEGKQPWQVFLLGAASIPLIIISIAIFALIGALLNGENIEDYVKIGAGLGVFFALLGILQMCMSTVFEVFSKNITFKHAALYMLGYFWMWMITAYIVYHFVLRA